jgi:hypothetical protein
MFQEENSPEDQNPSCTFEGSRLTPRKLWYFGQLLGTVDAIPASHCELRRAATNWFAQMRQADEDFVRDSEVSSNRWNVGLTNLVSTVPTPERFTSQLLKLYRDNFDFWWTMVNRYERAHLESREAFLQVRKQAFPGQHDALARASDALASGRIQACLHFKGAVDALLLEKQDGRIISPEEARSISLTLQVQNETVLKTKLCLLNTEFRDALLLASESDPFFVAVVDLQRRTSF